MATVESIQVGGRMGLDENNPRGGERAKRVLHTGVADPIGQSSDSAPSKWDVGAREHGEYVAVDRRDDGSDGVGDVHSKLTCQSTQ